LEGDSIRGTWKVGLARTGDKLSGTIAFTGSNVFSEAQVVGTITSSSVTLGVVANGQKQIDFVGSLDGESIRGEWTSDVLGDHGVWYGKLVRGQELRTMAIE